MSFSRRGMLIDENESLVCGCCRRVSGDGFNSCRMRGAGKGRLARVIARNRPIGFTCTIGEIQAGLTGRGPECGGAGPGQQPQRHKQ